MAVMYNVVQGIRPDLPKEGTPIPEKIWRVVTSCWAHQPTTRPHINDVVAFLEANCYALNRIEHFDTVMPNL
jgi:hypothetical protein